MQQQASAVAVDPGVGLVRARVVSLTLAATPAEASCPFWIGLASPGKLTPANLLDQPDIGTLLLEAATAGVSEAGPLMLSDTSVTPPRYVFLMPRPSASADERQAWVETLTSSLAAWAAPEVGIYVAPSAMSTQEGLALILDMLRAAIPQLPATRNFYLLTAGHVVNQVLNGLLTLKGDLDVPDLSLYVYH
jgi:hypothetical protein